MLAIADTSALLALAACGGLPLLDTLFQEVRVPPAVFRECTVPGKSEAEPLKDYLRNRVAEVDLAVCVIAAAGLGRGELEAMALYKHLRADRLLLDDRRARKVARFNAIEVMGSIGILLLAKARGLIPAVRPHLDAIQAAGIFLSEQLTEEALRLAEEG